MAKSVYVNDIQTNPASFKSSHGCSFGIWIENWHQTLWFCVEALFIGQEWAGFWSKYRDSNAYLNQCEKMTYTQTKLVTSHVMDVLFESESNINIRHSDFVLKRFLLGRNGQDFDLKYRDSDAWPNRCEKMKYTQTQLVTSQVMGALFELFRYVPGTVWYFLLGRIFLRIYDFNCHFQNHFL